MSAVVALPVAFTPHIRSADPVAASWLAEATLRLRREICWLWRQRGGEPATAGASLPPPGDATVESLDLMRFADSKRQFFETDITARHLTEQIEALRQARAPVAGPWTSIAYRLSLDDAAQLVMALGLIARADAASGPILGACHNDANASLPTLALAQRLCDDPLALLPIDVAHPLFRFGVLVLHGESAGANWQQRFEVTPLIATALLINDGQLPAELHVLPSEHSGPTPNPVLRAAALLLRDGPLTPQFVPLLGDNGSDFSEWATMLSRHSGRLVVQLRSSPLPDASRLAALAAWCWLYDADVLLPTLSSNPDEHGTSRRPDWPVVPLRWLAPMRDLHASRALPAAALQPPILLPATDFDTRAARFHKTLGPRAQGLQAAIAEMSRRFRISAGAIEAIGTAAASFDGVLSGEDLHALCRTQARPDLGNLAQLVLPRFTFDELVLPPSQMLQLGEMVQASRALTRVHYEWGTARAWNDAGLSVLFCGAPGTGKTMAAEAVAQELQLPMFRIDLSQVVNKYIGETEKNLKRVFDAAEESDCVLFFDEADALFGKRTSVKDAHDRFANIEISYLLERMERLKGIAVLATNRRKDLDEAFLRRLRYLIEFPLPGESERERLWRYVFPQAVDTSELDFAALARLFPLAGGHIRSIAFNACLQAERDGQACVGMRSVLFAVKRELDKLNRPSSQESFGQYHELVRPLFAEAAS